MSEPSDLQTRLAQRDHLLSTLQEETVKLLETHSQTLHEVIREREIERERGEQKQRDKKRHCVMRHCYLCEAFLQGTRETEDSQ